MGWSDSLNQATDRPQDRRVLPMSRETLGRRTARRNSRGCPVDDSARMQHHGDLSAIFPPPGCVRGESEAGAHQSAHERPLALGVFRWRGDDMRRFGRFSAGLAPDLRICRGVGGDLVHRRRRGRRRVNAVLLGSHTTPDVVALFGELCPGAIVAQRPVYLLGLLGTALQGIHPRPRPRPQLPNFPPGVLQHRHII